MTALDATLTQDIVRVVRQALVEDLGQGDITASLIPVSSVSTAHILAREKTVLCGQPWVNEVFRQLEPAVAIAWHHTDGDVLEAGTIVCVLDGPSRALLSGERAALNFLQTLSGTAARTRTYVDAISGSDTRLLDTRKTIPGLRLAQKYAVRCGGGSNHRVGLYDAYLIKENHIAAAGSILAAVGAVTENAAASVMVEIEVETLAQLDEALTTGADRVLLDNFTKDGLERAVALRKTRGKESIELEASGGITLDNVRAVADTGVDFISIGAVTKDVVAADYSMRFA